jgi:hypothetical protein
MSTDLGSEVDYTPLFIDLDESGIPSMFFGSPDFDNVEQQSNYIVLNDGTGRLYVARHDEFDGLARRIYEFLIANSFTLATSSYGKNSVFPKFIAVPKGDGSVRLAAELKAGEKNPETGQSQANYIYVEVPVAYNPRFDFTRDVAIDDRNRSGRLRTWAGDDTIRDFNAAATTTIDGGLGRNKVVYSGPSSAYSILRNSDGTTTVSTTVNGSYPQIRDRLRNVQLAQFTDKTVMIQ